jgi:hypothetical protein
MARQQIVCPEVKSSTHITTRKWGETPGSWSETGTPILGDIDLVKYSHFTGSNGTKYMEEPDPGSRYDPEILVTKSVYLAHWIKPPF